MTIRREEDSEESLAFIYLIEIFLRKQRIIVRLG